MHGHFRKLSGCGCILGGQLWEFLFAGAYVERHWRAMCFQLAYLMRWGSGVPNSISRGTPVEVLPDSVVVHGCSQRHKHVPDGMGKRDDPVRLEEDHTQAIDESPTGQLVQSIRVVLWKIWGKISCKGLEYSTVIQTLKTFGVWVNYHKKSTGGHRKLNNRYSADHIAQGYSTLTLRGPESAGFLSYLIINCTQLVSQV